MLRVNHSTYYKHFYSPESARAKEDKLIKTYILTLHGRYKKRLGVNKLTLLLLNPDEPNRIWIGDIDFLKLKRQTAKLILIFSTYKFPYSSISMDFTT